MNMENYTWFVTQTELHSTQLLPNTVIQLIAGVLGILGNTIVLLMYTRYIQDNTGTRYFIPILALVDLVGCISNVTKFQLEDSVQYFYPSLGLCKTLSFCMVLFGTHSALLISMIALQRYLLICRPFGQQMTIGRRRLAILITFVLSSGGAGPSLYIAGIREYPIHNISETLPSTCNFGYGSRVRIPYFGSLLVGSIITIIATICLYIPVVKTIYRRFHNQKAQSNDREKTNATQVTVFVLETGQRTNEQSFSEHEITSTSDETQKKSTNNQKGSREKMTRKISQMFFMIIVIYVVSFVTSLITTVYANIYGPPREGYRLNIYFFFLRFNLLNHISNPYIYWYFDIKFRQELYNFCHSCLRSSGRYNVY